MSISLDDQIVEIACPVCGKKIKKTVGWFKRNNQACPYGCGTTFDTKSFRRSIEELEKNFHKDFGKIIDK